MGRFFQQESVRIKDGRGTKNEHVLTSRWIFHGVGEGIGNAREFGSVIPDRRVSRVRILWYDNDDVVISNAATASFENETFQS